MGAAERYTCPVFDIRTGKPLDDTALCKLRQVHTQKAESAHRRSLQRLDAYIKGALIGLIIGLLLAIALIRLRSSVSSDIRVSVHKSSFVHSDMDRKATLTNS